MTRTFSRLAAIAASLLALLAFAGPAFATDPDHVSFTLEGCRLPAGATLPSNVICDDSQYTTGNLGKSWNELDLVPYRLTAKSGPDQTYTMAVALDAEDGGKPGYDVISSPVVNVSHSTSAAACQIVSVSGEKIMSPGMGGISKTRYRELTVHQAAGAICVFDYYGRLAIGSHLFPGSSLHANKALISDPGDATTGKITSSGIGAADVSIPVKEIAPQELSATLTAKEGSSYSWSVSKTASPNGINFGNTCGFTDEELTTTVTITVSWTREDPSPNGEVKVRTVVTAKNPAARLITVNATANVYEGSTQTTPVGSTLTATDVDVPANSQVDVIDHTELYTGSATSFNARATASYVDKLTGIPVTGTTSATATATKQPGLDPATSASATITDTESITGDGLSFSVAAPASGSFTNYTAGGHTTGPVNWNSGTVSSSGSVQFQKTIYLDEPRDLSGSNAGDLVDTAKVYVGLTEVASFTKHVPISATLECGSITIVKDALPNDAQDFSFSADTAESTTISGFSLDDDSDGTLSNSATFSGLKPGSYSVTEAETKGWVLTGLTCDDDSSQTVDERTADINVPAGGNVTCTFENTRIDTSIEIVKTGSPDVVHDGDNVIFTYAVSNPSSNNGSVSDVVVSDDKCANVEGPVSKTGGDGDDLLDPGETWTFTCTTPAKHSDEDANHVITNVATATGKDPYGDPVSDTDDDTTRVIHPAIAIDKTGPASATAGDKIAYVLTVTNPGDTSFAESTVKVADQQCNGDPVTLLGKGGDSSPGSLDPGDVWTYTCSLQTAAGDTNVENHATVEGTDELDRLVSSADAATTVLATQVVLGERVTPGAARLLGPSGCTAKAFNARIRGSKIATVTFLLDGKVAKKVKNTKNAKVIAFRVNPKKLRIGVHRLVVNVTFQAGSNTRPKTLRLSFQRCGKKLVAPRFTG